MSKSMGRHLAIARGTGDPPVYETFAATRETGFTINREPIDVTAGDDNGIRRLLAEPGERQLDISVSGLADGDALLEMALSGEPKLEQLRITLPSGATIEGSFFMGSMGRTGPYKEAETFEAEFQSAGAWSYTPAA